MCNENKLLKWICLILIVVQVVDGFAHEDLRVRREAKQGNNGNKKNKCPNSSDFVCKNGQCIPEENECDGTVDCDDESDESNACHRVKCPPFLFSCKYGACINTEKVCDGKPDCKDKSDETSPQCLNITATESCSETQFRCSSGQCIDEDLKCDGKPDCRDNSDEITETCWNIRCPRFTYRCKYGACVSGYAECNGVPECYDGSDEDHCKEKPQTGTCQLPEHPKHGSWTVVGFPPGTFAPLAAVNAGSVLAVSCGRGYALKGSKSIVCSYGNWSTQIGTCSVESVGTPSPPVIESGSCILPDHPSNGKWSVYKSTTEQHPGTRVADETILQIKCNKEYTLDTVFTTVTCLNGSWSSVIGQCKKTCPARYNSTTLTITCSNNDCSHPTDGTLARFKCAAFYEDQSLKGNSIDVCHNGSWSLNVPQCRPACGIKSVNAQTLIVNGTSTSKTAYPWQAALYEINGTRFVCGGSLISQRIITTAAHCVTNRDNGEPYSKDKYIVAVGKYYRSLSDQRDQHYEQKSKLEHLFVSDMYRGPIQNYLGDIAILVTEKTFQLSLKVQPVCLDEGLNYNAPHSSSTGYVSGWGYTTQTSDPSEELKELEIPFVQDSECKRELPEEFNKYLTFDKMCAGYLDKNKGVCQGDSGGGLVAKYDGRYYLIGIVSLSPREEGGGCDTNQYGLYTRVSLYVDFIVRHKGTFRPE